MVAGRVDALGRDLRERGQEARAEAQEEDALRDSSGKEKGGITDDGLKSATFFPFFFYKALNRSLIGLSKSYNWMCFVRVQYIFSSLSSLVVN